MLNLMIASDQPKQSLNEYQDGHLTVFFLAVKNGKPTFFNPDCWPHLQPMSPDADDSCLRLLAVPDPEQARRLNR